MPSSSREPVRRWMSSDTVRLIARILSVLILCGFVSFYIRYVRAWKTEEDETCKDLAPSSGAKSLALWGNRPSEELVGGSYVMSFAEIGMTAAYLTWYVVLGLSAVWLARG